MPFWDKDAIENISNAQSDNNLFFIEKPPGDERNSSGNYKPTFYISQNN